MIVIELNKLRRVMRRASLPLLLTTILPLWIGCGGGHSTVGGSNNSANGGGTGTNGNLSGGTAGDPNGTGDEDTRPLMTAASRTTALDAITAKMVATDNTDHTAYNNTLLAFLKTRSEFAAVGISRGCVWGRFKDDMTFLIPNNRHDPPGTSKLASALPRLSRDDSAPPTNVPDSTTFRYIDYFKDGEGFDYVTGQAQRYSYNFVSKGLGNASLDEYRHFNNIGAALISSHGGDADAIGSSGQFYGILSTDIRNAAEENDITTDLGKDVQARRLGLSLDPDDVELSKVTRKPAPQRYSINPKFVRKYWTFSPNSFLYASICDSASPEANGIIKACFDKKLSAYVGWSDSVSPLAAIRSSKYMIDRLLGANRTSAESPSQRPFLLEDVYNDMKTNHPDLTASTDKETGATAQLVIRRNPDISGSNGFGQLAPSIGYMTVDEIGEQLTLSGAFGNDPGSRGVVSISTTTDSKNTTLLSKVSWTPDTIVCKLPRTGNGSAGYVRVSVDGHQSNTVPLTEWRGTIRYTFGGDGTLTYGLTWNYHFRADVHTPRYQPGGKPDNTNSVVGFFEAQDSTCTFGAGGMSSDACDGGGSISRAWSGTATLKPLTGIDLNNPPTDGKIFHFTGVIKGGHSLELHIDSPKFDGFTIDGTDCDGSNIQATTGRVALAPETFGLHTSASSYVVNLTLGSDYTIPAKPLTGVTDRTDAYGDNNPNHVALNIEATTPKYAPKDSDGEDAGSRSVRRSLRR